MEAGQDLPPLGGHEILGIDVPTQGPGRPRVLGANTTGVEGHWLDGVSHSNHSVRSSHFGYMVAPSAQPRDVMNRSEVSLVQLVGVFVIPSSARMLAATSSLSCLAMA